MAVAALGHSVKESAELLGVTYKTADKMRQNVMRKMGVNSIVRLTHLALASGLVRNIYQIK